MSENEDELDDAWGDEPAAPPVPASSVPPKPVSSAPRPASSNPPQPVASTPSAAPKPASSSAPKPAASTPPAAARTAHSNKATLIGIPAPVPTPPPGKGDAYLPTPPEGMKAQAARLSERAADVEPTSVAPKEAPAATVPKSASIAPPVEAKKPSGDTAGAGKEKRPFSNTRADSPQAKDEHARTSSPLRVSVPPADAGTSSSRLLMVSLVLAALIMGGRWYFQSRDAGTPPAPPVAENAQAPAEALPAAKPTLPQPNATATASAVAAADAPSASAAEAASAAPVADAAPAPSASAAASANPTAPSAKAPPLGTRTVIVKISPAAARLFYKGKSVGSSPVTVDLAPGEKRRSFEVGSPGWVTRRLVVDGSKPEIFIGLKPEK